MRTAAVATSAACLTAIAATVAGTSGALAAPQHTARSTTTVISLVSHQRSEKELDLGKHGFSVGDQQIDNAWLTRNGTRTGLLDGICTVTFATHPVADEECLQTLALPGGSIESTGVVVSGQHGPKPFDWSIVGGTGRYSNASGYIHVLPGDKTVGLIVHVTR